MMMKVMMVSMFWFLEGICAVNDCVSLWFLEGICAVNECINHR